MRHTTLLSFALLTLLTVWWARDLEIDMGWNPAAIQTSQVNALRVTGEAVEQITSGRDGKITPFDRARATERARWKAYYFAQLRAAEKLGELELLGETRLKDLKFLDQNLTSRYRGTLRAATELESESRVEQLPDAVKAKVVVELAAEPIHDLRNMLKEAWKAGYIRVERRPRQPRVELSTESKIAPAGLNHSASRDSNQSPTSQLPKTVQATPAKNSTGIASTFSKVSTAPMRRAKPSYTGAVLLLPHGVARLNATPMVYDAAGSELGGALDLPSSRIAAGLRLVSAADAASIHRHAGASPRRFEATVSLGDLFLTEVLSGEQIEQFRRWVGRGHIVLVPEGGMPGRTVGRTTGGPS